MEGLLNSNIMNKVNRTSENKDNNDNNDKPIWDSFKNSNNDTKFHDIWQYILSADNKDTFSHWQKILEKTHNSIRPLAPSKKKLSGRDTEMKLLERVLERPHTPVAILLGDAGVGKTALVEGFARESLVNKIGRASCRERV